MIFDQPSDLCKSSSRCNLCYTLSIGTWKAQLSNQRCLCTVCYNEEDDDDYNCDDDIDRVQDKSDEVSVGDEFMDIFAQKD